MVNIRPCLPKKDTLVGAQNYIQMIIKYKKTLSQVKVQHLFFLSIMLQRMLHEGSRVESGVKLAMRWGVTLSSVGIPPLMSCPFFGRNFFIFFDPIGLPHLYYYQQHS